MNVTRRFRTSLALLAIVAGVSHAATPAHVYQFSGSLSDASGGPSMTAFGGTLGAGAFVFQANEGLAVSGAVAADVYTVDTRFTFSTTSGYRRIVDFKGGTSDNGLYNLDTALNFYNVVRGNGGVFAADRPVRVTITRDADDVFEGYVDGVLYLSFKDTNRDASFSEAGQLARFFMDDTAVGGEASAGSVDYIAFYDRALSAQEVATLAAPVPEPETHALMLAGLAAVAAAVRIRRRP